MILEKQKNENSKESLDDFIDLMAREEILHPATANIVKTALKRVLETQPTENLEDLESLNVNNAIDNFKEKYKDEFQASTMLDYEKKFRDYIGYFRQYIEDPDFRPYIARRASRTYPPQVNRRSYPYPTDSSLKMADNNLARTIKIPIPLRKDLIINLEIPKDLTKEESKRIEQVLSAMAL